MAGHADSNRAILFALGANFAIAVAKGVAAYLSGSGAMLAETVHSLADCGNQGLLLLGMKQAKSPASAEYPRAAATPESGTGTTTSASTGCSRASNRPSLSRDS